MKIKKYSWKNHILVKKVKTAKICKLFHILPDENLHKTDFSFALVQTQVGGGGEVPLSKPYPWLKHCPNITLHPAPPSLQESLEICPYAYSKICKEQVERSGKRTLFRFTHFTVIHLCFSDIRKL